MMMERSRTLTFALLLLCLWGGAECFFNTDIREPILRVSPGVLNDSHFVAYGEDFFGFAIALHQVEVVDPGDGAQETARKTRLIVGAPKGTYPGGLILDPPVGNLINTGLLYSCPILSSVDVSSCEAVLGGDTVGTMVDDITVTMENDFLSAGQRLFDYRPNAETRTQFNSDLQAEQKIGQLLGATVFSKNGRLVVCAPAWTSTGIYNPILGLDGNSPVLTNALPQGRCYSVNRDLSSVNFLDPCNVANEANVKLDEGYCTAGTDVDMLEPNRTIIGSPGYQFGIGTIFYGRDQSEFMERDSNVFGLGNINHISDQTNGVPQGILETSQGFQVESGYITFPRGSFPDPPNSLSSVPRYDSTLYRGKIDVYDAREEGGDIRQLLPIYVEGQQIAEFFGYALATVDLNGDNYDDVAVGAPMYSLIDPDIEVQVEIGRVYVFMNDGNGSLISEPIILEGSAYGGRLGMNVINIGDIDLDGYEDIAASAPYEVVGDHTGAVYIYYGRPDADSFRDQEPARVSSADIGDRLNVSLKTFGFSLSSLDVDNNQHNDLAIGALDSSAVIVLRSRPVANVIVSLVPLINSIPRATKNCAVGVVDYACFDVTVTITVTGVGIPDEIEVDIILGEMRSNSEQRVFFDKDPLVTQISSTLTYPGSREFTSTVYLLDDIIDSLSPLMLIAEVQQHEVSQPAPPTNGTPAITDLSNDYIIRQPAVAMGEVTLINNCGPDDRCQTDVELSLDSIVYLPRSNDLVEFNSIEEGGVTRVTVTFTLENIGNEDAIILMLNVTHSDNRVFQNGITVNVEGSVEECRPNEFCSLGDITAGDTMVFSVSFNVRINIPLIEFISTFTVSSMVTVDDVLSNNVVDVDFTVDRRADLQISVAFPQEQTLYSNVKPVEPVERSDVGMPVSMEVRVSNARSSQVQNAELVIYYPARADETGDYFYLLPDCVTGTAIMDGTITCDDSVLNDGITLPCMAGRRKRHIVSPAVKKRWSQSKNAGTFGLRRSTRATTSRDCSRTPEDCLSIKCTITQLQGLQANEAKVTLRGYVDERFFFNKDDTYELTAYASVTFNATEEGVMDQEELPDSASALLTISPPSSPTSDSSESPLTIIFVIVAVIIGAILFIVVVAIILYCCGFFKRKRKIVIDGTGEEDEGGVPPGTAPPETKPEGLGTDF